MISKEGLQGLALGPDRAVLHRRHGRRGPHPLWAGTRYHGQILEQDVVDPHYRLKISGLGYLDWPGYLHQQGQGTILVWDPVSDAEVRRLTTVNTSLHGGFASATDLGLLFDSNEVGTVYAINPRTGNVVHVETGGSLKRGVAYLNGELIAVDSGSPMAKRIDPQTDAPARRVPRRRVGYEVPFGAGRRRRGRWFGPPTHGGSPVGGGDRKRGFRRRPVRREIRGRMWHDLDGDGIRDDGEPPLEGWTIFLDADGDGVFKSGERSATTDAWGNYVFTLVPPGRHAVAEVLGPTGCRPFRGSRPRKGVCTRSGATTATGRDRRLRGSIPWPDRC